MELHWKSAGNTIHCFFSVDSFEIQNWMSTVAEESQRRQSCLTSAFVPWQIVHSCHFPSLFLLALHLPGWNKLSDCWLAALGSLIRDRGCQIYLFLPLMLVCSIAQGESCTQPCTLLLLSGDTGSTRHDSLNLDDSLDVIVLLWVSRVKLLIKREKLYEDYYCSVHFHHNFIHSWIFYFY